MPAPVPLNLMRRRKQQYRLRRRRFVFSNNEIFRPVVATGDEMPAIASAPREALPPADEARLRAAEYQVAQLRSDLRAAESLIKDCERRLIEKEALIAQKDSFIVEARRVVDEAKAQILRSKQDVEIHRKRMNREKEDMKKYAAEDLIRQILSPLDHFTLAVDQWTEGGSGESLGDGMMMVYREMMAALESIGLMSITATGGMFDPSIHDSASKIEDLNRADGEVVRIMRPGFQLRDKVLRPAIVEVNKLPGAGSVSATMSAGFEPQPLPPSAPPPPITPTTSDAVVEVRAHIQKDKTPINPRLSDTHSSPLDRARRMLESKFDDDRE